MAAMAAAIGPPRRPATRNTRNDAVIPGRYAIHLDTVLMAHPALLSVMSQLASGFVSSLFDASGRRDGFLRKASASSTRLLAASIASAESVASTLG